MRRGTAARLCTFPLLALLLVCGVAGCSGPEGMWRDQYVFVGDDGTVLPLGVLRWSSGHAEVKGWLGQGGAWRTSFHQRFPILGRRAPDLARTLATFSGAPDAPARVRLGGEARSTELTIRTPSRELSLSAEGLQELGRARDPEGVSEYRAGRARLAAGDMHGQGWLVVESTPADTPRRSFVDYGNFAFVVLADAERGVVVLKRSRGKDGFDRAFVRRDGSARAARGPRVDRTGEGLRVRLSEPELDTTLTVADSSTARGVAPGGGAVRYETLLLAGDYSGTAFLIMPGGD